MAGCTKGELRYPPDGDFLKLSKYAETCSITGKDIIIKVQHFRVKVTFYLLRVQYPWCQC